VRKFKNLKLTADNLQLKAEFLSFKF